MRLINSQWHLVGALPASSEGWPAGNPQTDLGSFPSAGDSPLVSLLFVLLPSVTGDEVSSVIAACEFSGTQPSTLNEHDCSLHLRK